MTKKLVVPALALGLALFGGCGSSSSSNTGGSGGATGGSGGSTGGSTGTGGSATGGSGGSTGGSGGATGGSGGATGGSGGATGGSGGATDGGATDGSAGDGSAMETGGMAAVDWTMCTGGSKPNVSAMDFCTRYMTVCGFDMTGGAATMERYKNMGECVSQYTALPTTDPAKGQACVAYHLCVAGTAPETNKATHCPHPPEASLMPAAGPCK